MIDEPDQQPQSNAPGSVNIGAHGDVTVGGDVVGRDKITTIITDDKTYDVAGLPNPYLGLRSFTYVLGLRTSLTVLSRKRLKTSLTVF